jgi:Domain of unknown function (DUF6891)
MADDFNALEHYEIQTGLLVWSGFFNEADLGVYLADLAYDPDAKDIAGEIESHARAEISKKREAEKAWPDTTDCDRLDAAFQALEDQKILALHNAGYTAQDAAADAWDIINREPKGAWDGYCYYHGQDVERAVQSFPLFIGFDAVADDEKAKRAIGERVAAALRGADFEVDWSGDPETRMSITNIDWKRRTQWERTGQSETAETLQAGPATGASLDGWFRGLLG